ncbi:MAG: aldehyde dehydrogenase family protein [Nitrospirae bacterium]|nr:aldehyde dehydrogenase family protein [Nitrospirota bacterium]
MPEAYKNFINGEWIPSKTGAAFNDINPANKDEIVGVFPKSGREDINMAVEAASAAFDKWRRTPAPARAEIIYNVEKLLRKKKETIAKTATKEMGKILDETKGDVQEAIDTAFYMAGEGRRLFGDTTTSELKNKFCMSVRMPVGVVGLICPWNFPVAIPSWKLFPALICGNTVVLKPASDAPASSMELVQLLEEAGAPKGVVNLVHGAGEEAGMALVAHPKVNLISFTGSAEVGKRIAEICGRNLKRCSLELGGKNAQIVMDDANIDLAVDGALWGAFGTTGQRCTATSRLIVHKDILKEFTEKFVERTKRIRIGNGLSADTDMGPVINESQLKKIHSFVDIGKKEGARLLTGGYFYEEGECKKGFFYMPTIFMDGHPSMRIAQEEIFGPVVVILPVNSFDEAIEVMNNTGYGLSSSIYTRDINKAFRAISDIQAGITYINSPTIGAETHLPFGGMKNSGNGHREAGKEVLNIFSEWKAVYIDYSGRLQKAQIDTVKEK